MTRFRVTHRSNEGRHLRPVNKTYELERAVEAVLDDSLKTARFMIDGFGPYTFHEAMAEVSLKLFISGVEPKVEVIGD